MKQARRHYTIMLGSTFLLTQPLKGMEEKKASWQTVCRYEAGRGHTYQKFIFHESKSCCNTFLKFYGIRENSVNDFEDNYAFSDLPLNTRGIFAFHSGRPVDFVDAHKVRNNGYWLSEDECERIILADIDDNASILEIQALKKIEPVLPKSGCCLLACIQSLWIHCKKK